ncbi:hypothetical protein [Streptomyces sp. NPDC054975]
MTTTSGAGRAEALRGRFRLGRLLPLGEATDGAWLAESAARRVLLRAAATVRGVVPGKLRVGLAEERPDAPFPVPPGGLPPGTLRITGDFAAEWAAGDARVAGRPLPVLAEEVREALFASADRDLGLVVTAVDLRVTGLAEAAPDSPAPTPPPGRTPAPAADDPVAFAVLGVPGVVGLTSVLGTPVHRAPGALRVELAVGVNHRSLDVARAVRARVAETAPGATAVTVLVAEIR